MRPRESCHWQCRTSSWDFFDPYATSAIAALKSINGHIPRAKHTCTSSGLFYEIRAIHANSYHWRQLESWLSSTRLNGVIYITDNDDWYDYRYHFCTAGQSSRYGAAIPDYTICDNHRQLSQSAPDWTTESDRLEGTKSHLRQHYSISSDIRQRANTVMRPYNGIRRWFLGIQWRWLLVCSRDSQDPGGYRMDRLRTLRRPAD